MAWCLFQREVEALPGLAVALRQLQSFRLMDLWVSWAGRQIFCCLLGHEVYQEKALLVFPQHLHRNTGSPCAELLPLFRSQGPSRRWQNTKPGCWTPDLTVDPEHQSNMVLSSAGASSRWSKSLPDFCPDIRSIKLLLVKWRSCLFLKGICNRCTPTVLQLAPCKQECSCWGMALSLLPDLCGNIPYDAGRICKHWAWRRRALPAAGRPCGSSNITYQGWLQLDQLWYSFWICKLQSKPNLVWCWI